MKSTVCKCIRRDEQVATPEIQRKQVMAEFTQKHILSFVTNLGEQYFGTVVVR